MTEKKHNKYAHLSSPQAVFDFHGRGVLTEQQICSLAQLFVFESIENGYSRVLIVVGKGLHSQDWPVIGPLLMRFLPTMKEVKSVKTARRDRGGDGAIEVQLKFKK